MFIYVTRIRVNIRIKIKNKSRFKKQTSKSKMLKIIKIRNKIHNSRGKVLVNEMG